MCSCDCVCMCAYARASFVNVISFIRNSIYIHTVYDAVMLALYRKACRDVTSMSMLIFDVFVLDEYFLLRFQVSFV